MGAAIPSFQSAEKGVMFKPVLLLLAKLLVGSRQLFAGPGVETGPRLLEQPVLEGNDNVVVYRLGLERNAFAIARAQQAVFHKPIRTDQQRVARKRRMGLVRRVTSLKRVPPTLPCLAKPIDPPQRTRPHVANTVG